MLSSLPKQEIAERFDLEPLLTVDELAAYLKVTRRTVYRMLEDQNLPFAFKVKGSWRFRAKDVTGWIERQKLLDRQSVTV